ncbi:hypothetical protein GCM10023094_32250 [Rhodococcus olei]|uniref:MFS transporter n=1 Tax=Rhodococcus olei TaxID=2161675 RepID=A0ABP8P5V7_9NOCA
MNRPSSITAPTDRCARRAPIAAVLALFACYCTVGFLRPASTLGRYVA